MTKSVYIIIFAVFFQFSPAFSGELDSPAPPDDPAGAMWTLDDIYNVLDTRTTNVAKRAGPFAEPSEGQSMSNLEDIMGLLKNRAALPRTGEAPMESMPGVAWPDPRFVTTTNGVDEVVADKLTGLVWVRAPHSLSGNAGVLSWSDAVDLCNNLSYAGYSDWRLPNRRELETLLHLGVSNSSDWLNSQGFSGIMHADYWSSSSYTVSYIWRIEMHRDVISPYGDKGSHSHYAWPVRGGR